MQEALNGDVRDRSESVESNDEPRSFLLLVVMPGATFVASLLIVAMPFVTSSFLLLVARR